MLKKHIKSFILFGAILSGNVLAAPGEWMPDAKKISSIVVEGTDDGTALILIEGGVPADYIPAACRASPYNTIPLNTNKGKGMYSLALAAHASGKPIKLALTCIGDRPLITNMWVFQ